MDHDGSNLRKILTHAANPEWGPETPDGYSLYFDSKVTGRAQIWTTQLAK